MTRPRQREREQPLRNDHDPNRPGTTLIELLMVVMIISVILSLILPAIHASRGAASRVQCTNNLKQIGLALHNYETNLGTFPPGVVNPTGPISNVPEDFHIGWVVQLLPYMEQGGVAGALDTRFSVYDAVNQTARLTRITSLTCPDDKLPGGTALANHTSYAANHHDVEAPIEEDNHGVFFLNKALRTADLEDGSSHTIFVGDKRTELGDLGWSSGTRATLRNTGHPLRASLRGPQDPPEPEPTDEWYVGGFGSGHPGAVNFAFGDGSVRFLSTTINPRILRLLGHRADGEPLGGSEY
ncbi:MAG: DUF1559 domain-containing protein [Isosphaeraceae bacterium]